MEFSSRLAQIADLLILPRSRKLEAFLHSPATENQNRWLAVVDFEDLDCWKAKGTGISTQRQDACLKALVELGENLIVRKNGFLDRNGIAGGIFFSTASLRAKYELCERDSFLFHYRNKIPFISVEPAFSKNIGLEVLVFEMISAVSGVFSYFVTTGQSANGLAECLLMGLGASADPMTAKLKAMNEFATMYFDHQLRPGWCTFLAEGKKKITRLPDLHHIASRDLRNRERLRVMCSVCAATNMGSRPLKFSIDDASWRVESLDSPVRFIKYARVINDDLLKLDFGFPESDQYQELEGPLMHPVW